MKLKQCLAHFPQIQVRGKKDLIFSGISSDSRRVAPGHLFVAKQGLSCRGDLFIPQALQSGAVAVLTDLYNPSLSVTQLIHPNPASLEAPLASYFYQYPSRQLSVIGVTGSKGKTTTSYWMHHLFSHLGFSCGLMTTVEILFQKMYFASELTTHDVIFNQKILKEMGQSGCKIVVMEVSSHGLDQGRVDAIDFPVAVFTNLYPDHLDYHQTMEHYALAKRKLLERASRFVIVNVESPWEGFMVQNVRVPIFRYGFQEGVDLRARLLHSTLEGMEVELIYHQERASAFFPFMGTFNLLNLLAAMAGVLVEGATFTQVVGALCACQPVPGRLQRVEGSRNVWVDFAHTGEALQDLLSSVRQMIEGRIFVVFGCGGQRDPQRRKQMALAAERGADWSIITSDNPRQEDPQAIAQEILEGFSDTSRTLVILDRKEAIERAIALCKPQDGVFIVGKGHEKTQIFASVARPFDDVEVAKEALQKLAQSEIL